MKALLDTHVWLWWIDSPKKLRREVYNLIARHQSTVWFSIASAWEISIKYGLGKMPLAEPPERFIPPRLERDRISVLPIQLPHVFRLALLPHHHRDPFDRLLIAQAQIESLPIVTDDPRFSAYEVQVIRAS